MLKIATHDSVTGERGHGILSWLVTPFARTQRKTLREQYEAGCRMFDLRVRHSGDTWRCAHGLWLSKRSIYSILVEIETYPEECYVVLTYEGDKKYLKAFEQFAETCKKCTHRIKWGGIAVKYGEGSSLFKVKYEYIEPYPQDFPKNEQAFLPLDGRTWHTLLPIPWLWKKLYNDKVEFNNEVYKFVDFL